MINALEARDAIVLTVKARHRSIPCRRRTTSSSFFASCALGTFTRALKKQRPPCSCRWPDFSTPTLDHPRKSFRAMLRTFSCGLLLLESLENCGNALYDLMALAVPSTGAINVFPFSFSRSPYFSFYRRLKFIVIVYKVLMVVG
jgi:hypothetical protein